MIFITESVIDSLIEKYETEESYMNDFAILVHEQKDLNAFLDQENYSLLTKEEMALLEYLSCIIYISCKTSIKKVPLITGKTLEKWEEENWDAFNESNNKNFAKVLDKFFEGYKQEDLLALVEDSIQMDEESVVTTVGGEIIFVACKSIIDTIDQLN
jgi:hypothetical protein